MPFLQKHFSRFGRLLLPGLLCINAFFGNFAAAQQVSGRLHYIAVKTTTPSEQSANVALKSAFPFLSTTDMRLESISHSPYADYLFFRQYYYNTPIAESGIKWIIPHQGDTSRLLGAVYDTSKWSIIPAEISLRFDRINETLHALNIPYMEASKCWYVANMWPELHYTYTHNYGNGITYTLHFNRGGDLIMQEDHLVYFSLPDTTVAGKVFLPDPLTTAEATYGGDYVDDDDADLDVLNAQRVDVRIPAQFEDGVFYLRTDSLLLKDINAPTIPIVTSITDTMEFTRNNAGFEDVNTMYHITNLFQYLSSIGYHELQNFYLEVDPHGSSGADASFYTGIPIPSIQYGEGGVDDAEDADVIIHELTHALSDHASPDTNTGLERKAVDEGYGDYFAVSYSRGYSDFLWKNVFSWDAHNEFWFGRNADTDKHYPEDNNDNYYASSEIWSGALMDIFDLLGKEITDRLVSEAMYGSVPNMTMPDAAQLILNAESLLYGGIYHDIVFDALYLRGLVWPDEIHTVTTAGIQISNTQAYAIGSEPILITLDSPSPCKWQLYTLDGKLIAENNFYGNAASIDVHPVSGQIFLLYVSTPSGSLSTLITAL